MALPATLVIRSAGRRAAHRDAAAAIAEAFALMPVAPPLIAPVPAIVDGAAAVVAEGRVDAVPGGARDAPDVLDRDAAGEHRRRDAVGRALHVADRRVGCRAADRDGAAKAAVHHDAPAAPAVPVTLPVPATVSTPAIDQRRIDAGSRPRFMSPSTLAAVPLPPTMILPDVDEKLAAVRPWPPSLIVPGPANVMLPVAVTLSTLVPPCAGVAPVPTVMVPALLNVTSPLVAVAAWLLVMASPLPLMTTEGSIVTVTMPPASKSCCRSDELAVPASVLVVLVVVVLVEQVTALGAAVTAHCAMAFPGAPSDQGEAKRRAGEQTGTANRATAPRRRRESCRGRILIGAHQPWPQARPRSIGMNAGRAN